MTQLNVPPEKSPPPHSAPPATPRQVIVQGVLWQNVLEFGHLFRGFRLAINPAKLAIALLAIMLIYGAGRAFDATWRPQVYPHEIDAFAAADAQSPPNLRSQQNVSDQFSLAAKLKEVAAYDYRYTIGPLNDQSLSPAAIDELAKNPSEAFAVLKSGYEKKFAEEVDEAKIVGIAGEKLGMGGHAAEEEARRQAAARLLANIEQARDLAGHGIFDSLAKYEMHEFDLLVANALGIVRVAANPVAAADGAADVTIGIVTTNPDRFWRSDSVAGCAANMLITGPRWFFTATAPMQWRPAEGTDTWAGWMKMIAHRGLYLATALAFTAFCLLLIAIAGGSISRLSALEFSGVDRPPLKDVFGFAFSRLAVFIKAPLMPLGILFAVGLLLTLGGMLGAVPFVGEIAIGILFILFLAVAFVMMLLLIGIIGGFGLLYPTIAVEGADAFDAMSRSFAYAYARPWRLLFFSMISLIYGALTFLFVSFAVFLILFLTHLFVGWGMGLFGHHDGWLSGSDKLETLWPTPHFGSLIAPINWYAMNGAEYIGAIFLHFWVFLLITGIGAYVLSYYFSSHTIIYLLIRRSVDGQGIREVYVEEPEPKATSPAAAPAPQASAPAANSSG